LHLDYFRRFARYAYQFADLDFTGDCAAQSVLAQVGTPRSLSGAGDKARMRSARHRRDFAQECRRS
jgi:hypothetical protein